MYLVLPIASIPEFSSKRKRKEKGMFKVHKIKGESLGGLGIATKGQKWYSGITRKNVKNKRREKIYELCINEP